MIGTTRSALCRSSPGTGACPPLRSPGYPVKADERPCDQAACVQRWPSRLATRRRPQGKSVMVRLMLGCGGRAGAAGAGWRLAGLALRGGRRRGAAGCWLLVAVWCCGRDRRSRSAWLGYPVAGAARQSRFRSGRQAVAVSGDAPEPRLPKAPSCSPQVAGVSGRGRRAGCGPARAGLRYRGLPWSGTHGLPPTTSPARADDGRTVLSPPRPDRLTERHHRKCDRAVSYTVP